MLTHTRPWPPPGAGVAALVAAVTGAAEGEVLTELLGLNKPPNLLGDADAAGLATGLATVSVFAFLRVRFSLGEAAGDSAVEGDAAFSVGEAVTSAFLCVRCLAGDAAGEGD